MEAPGTRPPALEPVKDELPLPASAYELPSAPRHSILTVPPSDHAHTAAHATDSGKKAVKVPSYAGKAHRKLWRRAGATVCLGAFALRLFLSIADLINTVQTQTNQESFSWTRVGLDILVVVVQSTGLVRWATHDRSFDKLHVFRVMVTIAFFAMPISTFVGYWKGAPGMGKLWILQMSLVVFAAVIFRVCGGGAVGMSILISLHTVWYILAGVAILRTTDAARDTALQIIWFDVIAAYLCQLAVMLTVEAMTRTIHALLRMMDDLNEEMDRQRASFQRLISTVSHNMGSAVGVISSTVGLLADPEQDTRVGTILETCEDLSLRSEDLLWYARLAAKAIPLVPADFNVRRMLRSLQDRWEPIVNREAEGGGARRWLEVSADLPPEAETRCGDRAVVEAVLNRLLRNAVKHCSEGCITLSASRSPEEDQVEFAVKDSGEGIPEEKVSSLFKPKFEVLDGNSPEHEEGEGTAAVCLGLGLANCAGLAELMGAQLTVSRSPSGGAAFNFVTPLPVVAGAASKQTPATGGASVGARSPLSAANEREPLQAQPRLSALRLGVLRKEVAGPSAPASTSTASTFAGSLSASAVVLENG
eukprot:RCo012503